MISSDFDKFFGSRWDEVYLRLEPLLGDVQAALGSDWHEKVEALFTAADLAVAQSLLQVHRVPQWYFIHFAPAGRHLDWGGERLVCASSWTEAVAVLLAACEQHRCLPSRIEYDEVSRTLRLFVGETLLASVGPQQSEYVSPSLRRQAMGTICELRERGRSSMELLQRVRRWPGMEGVSPNDPHHDEAIQGFREHMLHQPIPNEWLQSARVLLTLCGNDSPSTEQVQAVATTALGAQSWSQLAGPLGDCSARVLQPWYLSDDAGILSFHADAIDAVATLLTKAPRFWMSGWAGCTFRAQYSFTTLDYVPTYTLIEKTAKSTIDAPSIAAYPVIRAGRPDPAVIKRVASLLAPSVEDIAALFGIGLPVDAKARMLDERSAEVLIIQEGPWRFTRAGGPSETNAYVWVHCLDNAGNSVHSACVPAYKGLLQTHRDTGTYVLCADYDGQDPVAVINGLSPTAAAQVRANLPDTTAERMDYCEDAHCSRDVEVFRKLMNRALSRRDPA